MYHLVYFCLPASLFVCPFFYMTLSVCLSIINFIPRSPPPHPSAAAQDCLSPLQIFPDSLMGRPQPVLVERTSMGLVFNWTAPTLHDSCASQVFSFPPLSYDVVIDFAMETLEGYPQVRVTVLCARKLEGSVVIA